MKKILSLLLFTLTFFAATAQVNTKKAHSDTLLKILTRSVKGIDTMSMPILDQPITFNQNLIYKLRLDSIQKTIPLSYNQYVQDYIDIYSQRKDQFGKMLGLGNYYFPIFEKALTAYNIPTEIKYLPVIESSMNPHAISRVGATGMWQFMFGTAKGYGLNMDNFVDERKDPIQASYAAAAYFRDAYEELGDWLLAIAAYNCGKGNVTRAIDKAGSRDFWQIRDYLPKETRNYVPAFIAAIYMMSYPKNHEIVSIAPSFNIKTDTVLVNHFVSLSDMAKAIDYDETTLITLNPSFKKKIVNGTYDVPKRVILPKVELRQYAALYTLLNVDLATNERTVILAGTDDARDLRKKKVVVAAEKPRFFEHKISVGQSLSAIATKYNVEIQDLKVWNKLPSNTLVPGQKIKIYNMGFKPTMPANYQPSFVSYKVKIGDTLSTIAEKFDGVTVAEIKKANGLSKSALKPGQILKIDKS